MLKERIVVGKSYVNENACILREVVAEVDRRHVRTAAFDLASGRLIPTRHSIWRRSQLARWADREASPGELARVHPYQERTWFDGLFPPSQAGTPVEQAKAMFQAVPGHMTFPKIK